MPIGHYPPSQARTDLSGRTADLGSEGIYSIDDLYYESIPSKSDATPGQVFPPDYYDYPSSHSSGGEGFPSEGKEGCLRPEDLYENYHKCQASQIAGSEVDHGAVLSNVASSVAAP
jgi:hypothetical protein